MTRRPRGFTLIEVMVALAIMALLALLTWRGIDGMTRAQQATRAHTDGVLALQAGLAQWRADLDAMRVWDAAGAPHLVQRSLAWDGRTLRITRTDSADPAAGLRVVAWTRSDAGAWRRWQSPPLQTSAAWAAAWQQAALWGQGAAPGADMQAVTLAQATDWQLHFFRNNAWSNAASSDAENAAVTSRLPLAVRLRLELAAGQPISGPLSIDWLQPTFRPGAP